MKSDAGKMVEPDPALIESMAFRYRHDFGLLSERAQASIRTTMLQLWEEVVGRGFYRRESSVNVAQLNRDLCEKEGHVLGVSCRPCLRCHAQFALEPGEQPEPAFLIRFEDADRPPEIFIHGSNAETSARRRFEQVLARGWNAHLFQRIDDGSRPSSITKSALPDAHNPQKGEKPAWKCSHCGQMNSGWAEHCGRCEYSKQALRDGVSHDRDCHVFWAGGCTCSSKNGSGE